MGDVLQPAQPELSMLDFLTLSKVGCKGSEKQEQGLNKGLELISKKALHSTGDP